MAVKTLTKKSNNSRKCAPPHNKDLYETGDGAYYTVGKEKAICILEIINNIKELGFNPDWISFYDQTDDFEKRIKIKNILDIETMEDILKLIDRE